MGDQLTDLLRERLTGHEMDVPPGAWEHVSGQLAANASGESLRKSLQDKFQGHEVKVDPSAWTNISGQLGHGAPVGSSLSTALIAAGVAAVVITATVLFWNSGTTEQKTAVPEKPAVAVVETPTSVSAPAATLQTLPETEPVPNSPAERSVPEKAVTTASPQDEQRSVTPALLPAPKPVAVPEKSPTVNNTPEPEQKPVSVQPKATVPVIPVPEPETIPEPNVGTDTPEASPDNDQSGTPLTVTDPEADRSGDDPFQSAAAKEIFIPNVFSPQGDGVNDKLKIVARDYEKADVRVFAAKGGALVFHSNDLSNMWDGRLPNGNIAEEGYYKCVVMLTDTDGPPRVKSEVVRLFR